jgi:DNA-binding response OmpR family regulator
VGDLRYDLDTLRVERAGQPLHIGPIGLKLLAELMRRSPAVVTRAALEDAVWGDEPPDSDSLRRHVHQLRQQVDRGYSRPLLQTVHGIGYRLAEA